MYAKARNNRDSFHDFVSSSNGAELNDGERKKLLQLVNGWDNAGTLLYCNYTVSIANYCGSRGDKRQLYKLY